MRRAYTFVAFTLAVGLTGLAAPPSKPGGLDSTFGTKGIVTTDLGSVTTGGTSGTVDVGYAVAINQVSDQTIAVGYTCPLTGSLAGGCDFAVAAYSNVDGSLVWTQTTAFFGGSETDAATAVAIDGSGNIYVAGSTCPASIGQGALPCEFAIARYTSGGSLDHTFNTTGLVTTDIASMVDSSNQNRTANGEAIAVNLTSIVVAGETTCSSTPGCIDEFAVVTYDLNGNLLSGFGTSGVATTSFGSNYSVPVGVAFDPTTGNIIAAGTYSDGSGSNQIGLACYQSDGSACTTFGSNGVVTASTAPLPAIATASAGGMETNSNGQITVAGTSSGNFVVARYQADGTLDPSFNSTGVVTTSFGKNKSVSGYAVAENASSGEIVVVGSTGSDFAVAAYNSDGSSAWTTTTGFGHGKNVNSAATGVAIDSQTSNITAAGYTNATSGGDRDFALARYIP